MPDTVSGMTSSSTTVGDGMRQARRAPEDGLQWWINTASRAHTRTPSLPEVAGAEEGQGHGGTRVEPRRVDGKTVQVLVVDKRDVDDHTGSPVGKWIAVNALARDKKPYSHARAGFGLPAFLIAAGLLAGLSILGNRDNMTIIVLALAAFFLTAGGAWMLTVRWRRWTDRLWSADDVATSSTSITAAAGALDRGDGELYKTVVHALVKRYSPANPERRLARLRVRHPSQ